MPTAMIPALLCFASLLSAPPAASLPRYQAASPPSFWRPVSPAQAKRLGRPRLIPRHYRVLRLNVAGLQQVLATVPAGPNGPIVLLPLPDGSLASYQLRTTSVMSAALAAKYPQLRTYAGQEVGDPASDVRLEMTPTGLRAMLIRRGHAFFIEPYRAADTQHYLSFDKASLPPGSKQGFEVVQPVSR